MGREPSTGEGEVLGIAVEADESPRDADRLEHRQGVPAASEGQVGGGVARPQVECGKHLREQDRLVTDALGRGVAFFGIRAQGAAARVARCTP
ncbi:MAG: hypothetical protein RJA16_1870 [Planctomycetota bacterium]